ncbi:hypothetical protein EV363DRAFT_1350927, partial [Boletus edulis]
MPSRHRVPGTGTGANLLSSPSHHHPHYAHLRPSALLSSWSKLEDTHSMSVLVPNFHLPTRVNMRWLINRYSEETTRGCQWECGIYEPSQIEYLDVKSLNETHCARAVGCTSEMGMLMSANSIVIVVPATRHFAKRRDFSPRSSRKLAGPPEPDSTSRTRPRHLYPIPPNDCMLLQTVLPTWLAAYPKSTCEILNRGKFRNMCMVAVWRKHVDLSGADG